MPNTTATYAKSPSELVQALVDAGWSQRVIADRLGVRQPTISRILHRKHNDVSNNTVEGLRRLVTDLN